MGFSSQGLDNYGKHAESQTKPVLPLGTPDFVFPSQIGYSQSMARIPYPYAEPYMNGYLAAYGPQAVIHPQMIGMVPARVPLPLDVTDDEPIYVNAKQYRGILRRRQSRAKLEAQNKLAKGRKPYLHESRHLHALRRARGSGGRFLDTKKLQETKSVASDGHEALDSASLQQGRNLSESEVLQSETGTAGASATSDITSISNSDEICRQPDPRFSVYAPRGGHSMQSGGVGIVCNGSELRVPIMR
ncbi:PREDICTED: nuclear transcription factor Y subunit A-4-like isoform X2 [Nelumbo nucifera]|uniref:Nuclear transcription factor Y subunit n=1 Tax=Nelumbo nucifera TaxID=4432 RepID=A0A1U8AHR7_NELNU|nr:PREDICTED: nuclear transcription factor Y subunit A-4-like isoform X2 [Nelumbo nucifera]